MTSKMFFMADGAGEHPGTTHLRDFTPMPFVKLMVLFITSILNASLFHFLAWLHPPFKKYFADPD